MESLRSRCCQMPSGYLMLSSVNCKGEKKSNNPIFIHIPVKRIRVVKRGPMHANECRNYLFFLHTAESLLQLQEKHSEGHTIAASR